MSGVETRLLIKIGEAGADAERLEEISQRLRAELLALDVRDVAPVPGEAAPVGSRGDGLAVLGALVASFEGSVALVERLVRVVRTWLRGGGTVVRTAELTVGSTTIKLTGVSDEQQDRLIEEFARAVAGD